MKSDYNKQLITVITLSKNCLFEMLIKLAKFTITDIDNNLFIFTNVNLLYLG
jgi:hypothetical protein